MKATLLVTAVALAASVFTVAAQAQTGRPSALEVPSADATPHAAAADDQLGSYGRYLMLNGVTRDEAVADARNIDHPVVRSRLAARDRVPADAKASVRQ